MYNFHLNIQSQCIILLLSVPAGNSRQKNSLLYQYLIIYCGYANFGQIDLEFTFKVTVTVISKDICKFNTSKYAGSEFVHISYVA
jgi:hypothetical protein